MRTLMRKLNVYENGEVDKLNIDAVHAKTLTYIDTNPHLQNIEVVDDAFSENIYW